MTMARKTVVDTDEVRVYHCIYRCVRRAFLCGYDACEGCHFICGVAQVRPRTARD